jgi:hypothetical protein
MFNLMKTTVILLIVVGMFGFFGSVDRAEAQRTDLRSRLLASEGKTFSGMNDPEFASYDLILREYVARRIQKRYGIRVDPKAYASGFKILEFESLLKCMKPGETAEQYLQKTQKGP